MFQRTLTLVALIAAVVFTRTTSASEQSVMFSAGDGYERFMGRWSRDLAPLLVKFAGVRNGDAVLDVGSGTGALTAAIAAAAPSSRIIGIDPAASYVAFAQTRHPGDRVRFEVGDAQQLRFADGSFDRTLSLLVLNFIPDPATALDEMVRVTRPGGTITAAVWDYGQGMEMLRVFWDEAVALNPAEDSRDERHMPLSRKGELDALWREHRLQDVSEADLAIRMRFSSFDDHRAPFLEKQGPAGEYVASLRASEREQLRLRLRRRLLGDGPDRPIVLAARAWTVRGIVPRRVASAHPPERGPHSRLSRRFQPLISGQRFHRAGLRAWRYRFRVLLEHDWTHFVQPRLRNGKHFLGVISDAARRAGGATRLGLAANEPLQTQFVAFANVPKPVPEPSTLLLMATGALVSGRRLLRAVRR